LPVVATTSWGATKMKGSGAGSLEARQIDFFSLIRIGW
jgi:hypothetical protein